VSILVDICTYESAQFSEWFGIFAFKLVLLHFCLLGANAPAAHNVLREGNIVNNLHTSAVLDLSLAHKISLLVFDELSCPTVFLEEDASIA